MRRTTRATLLVTTALLLVAAKRNNKATIPETVGPTVVPQANLFLRNAPDTDPSAYIGRFLPDSMPLFDDTNGSKRSCSKYISYKVVGGGNITHDEVFSASSSALASWGVPPVVDVKLGGGSENVIRVSYVLTHKMMSDIADPEGFDACCKAYPDQCTGRYLGEFLEGTGTVWHAVGKGADADVGVISEYGVGKVEAKFGVSWQSAVAFPSPVYFAFKSVDSGITAMPQGCGDWVDHAPTSPSGQYFVGTTEPVSTETEARTRAMLNARTQAVEWVGVTIQESQSAASATAGQRDMLGSALSDKTFLDSAASGLAAYVKDQNWCVKGTPDGRVQAWALAFLPNASTSDAAAQVLGAAQGRK